MLAAEGIKLDLHVCLNMNLGVHLLRIFML